MEYLLKVSNIDIERLLKPRFELSKSRALVICIIITTIVMVIEFAGSLYTGSLMLYSDSLHMLSHAGSLLISYVAIQIAYIQKKKNIGRKLISNPEDRAAFINGVGLIVFVGYILVESFIRLQTPTPVMCVETLIVAFIGLAVNIATAVILSTAGLEDLNTKSAFLHMLADTFSSVAIIIGAIIIQYTDWYFIDPLLSVIIAIVIAKWAMGLLVKSKHAFK